MFQLSFFTQLSGFSTRYYTQNTVASVRVKVHFHFQIKSQKFYTFYLTLPCIYTSTLKKNKTILKKSVPFNKYQLRAIKNRKRSEVTQPDVNLRKMCNFSRNYVKFGAEICDELKALCEIYSREIRGSGSSRDKKVLERKQGSNTKFPGM